MLNFSKQLNTCAGLFRPFNVLNRQVLLLPFYLQVQADFLRIGCFNLQRLLSSVLPAFLSDFQEFLQSLS